MGLGVVSEAWKPWAASAHSRVAVGIGTSMWSGVWPGVLVSGAVGGRTGCWSGMGSSGGSSSSDVLVVVGERGVAGVWARASSSVTELLWGCASVS
jgi:hypothetical protein